MVPVAGMASLAGYTAVVCVLALIQHHGSVLAECVKSLRKVLQVGVAPCVCSAMYQASAHGSTTSLGGLHWLASGATQHAEHGQGPELCVYAASQVAASLLVFRRPFSLAYVAGLALMACGMGLYQGDRARQGRQGAQPAEELPYRMLGRWRSDLDGISEHSENSMTSSNA